MSFIGIDQGTSSTKACRFEAPEDMSVRAVRPAPQCFPGPRMIEQDPLELLEGVIEAAREVYAAEGSPVTALGLANQGETFLLYDRESGEPLCPAVSWQDSRSHEYVRRLEREGVRDEIKRRTGLELHPQFPATKLHGLLDEPWARERRRVGTLAFGTLDAWLINRLCPERPHATDPSTAARTMLFNLETCTWDPWLCELFGVPIEILPEVRSSDDFFGTVGVIDGVGVPLLASVVDTGAALFGQCCFDKGDAKNSFGTCSALWVNLSDQPSLTAGVLDTIAWAREGSPTYAIDAEVLASGSIVTWLSGPIGLAPDAASLDRLATGGRDDGHVIFVPALTGLGAPHWDDGVTACLIGMRADTTSAEVARACLESIAFSLGDAAATVRAAGHEIAELRVDGGLTQSAFLMQRCADVLGIPVLVAQTAEATAYGVAALAGLGSGEVRSTDDLRSAWRARARYEPVWTEEQRDERFGRWRSAVAVMRESWFARIDEADEEASPR